LARRAKPRDGVGSRVHEGPEKHNELHWWRMRRLQVKISFDSEPKPSCHGPTDPSHCRLSYCAWRRCSSARSRMFRKHQTGHRRDSLAIFRNAKLRPNAALSGDATAPEKVNHQRNQRYYQQNCGSAHRQHGMPKIPAATLQVELQAATGTSPRDGKFLFLRGL